MINKYNSLPVIKRARGYLLYSNRGERYLDFYQDNGKVILGHRLEGISGVIKSTVSRGLTASYPSVYTSRFEKQLRLMFPDITGFRVYGNLERALKALSVFAGRSLEEEDIIDFPSVSDDFGFWRPFLNIDPSCFVSRAFIPLLPAVGSYGPVVVCTVNGSDLPPSDLLSPMFYDILIKSVSSLVRMQEEVDSGMWEIFDSKIWERFGPYLRFKIGPEEYSSLFVKALECGVVLPPSVESPGIVPLKYEAGQVRSFLKMIRSSYGVK